MNRQQKEVVISTIEQDFSQNPASFIVGVSGLSVEKFETLRSDLRKENAKMRVAKVRLMKRALADTQVSQELDPYLKEQVALVFAQEPSSIAKMLCGFAKENEEFSVIAGCMDGASVLDVDAVKTIASLPPREVLLAQLAATLQAPISGLAVTLHQVMAKLVYALNAVKEKKEA